MLSACLVPGRIFQSGSEDFQHAAPSLSDGMMAADKCRRY